MTMKPRAGLYCRVSTSHQADKASLKTQQERLTAYAQAHGYEIVDTYADVGSGKDTKCTELDRLLNDCKIGRVNLVLVTKLDRITRSTRDLDKLLTLFAEYGVTFVSISENIDSSSAMGRFMRDLLGLLARLEREITGERVATDMRHRAEKGLFNGGKPPYGYMSQKAVYKRLLKAGRSEEDAQTEAAARCPQKGKLYRDDTEAGNVRLMFDLFLEKKSLRKTALTLNAQGMRTRKGGMWSVESVRHILNNPVYCGLVQYAKTATDPVSQKLIKQADWIVAQGEHDPVITQDLFDTVQAVLSTKQFKPVKTGRVYLLSGLLKCGLCASPMSGGISRRATAKTYAYYKCKGRDAYGEAFCQGVTWPADALETYVIDELKTLSQDHTFLQDKAMMLQEVKTQIETADPAQEQERLDQAIRTVRRKMERLLTAFEDELETEPLVKARFKTLRDELTALEERRESLTDEGRRRWGGYDTMELSFEQLSDFTQQWEFLNEEGKRSRLQAIVKEIRATQATVEIELFLDVGVLSDTAASW